MGHFWEGGRNEITALERCQPTRDGEMAFCASQTTLLLLMQIAQHLWGTCIGSSLPPHYLPKKVISRVIPPWEEWGKINSGKKLSLREVVFENISSAQSGACSQGWLVFAFILDNLE